MQNIILAHAGNFAHVHPKDITIIIVAVVVLACLALAIFTRERN